METFQLVTGAFLVAYVLFKILTKPDPEEQLVYHQMSRVLNDPQYRVKGKYEE